MFMDIFTPAPLDSLSKNGRLVMRYKNPRLTSCAPVIICLMGLGPSGAVLAAEPATGDVLEEVLVSAQRREQNIMDVPVSVSALSGEVLQSLGFNNMTQVASQVPGLSFADTGPTTIFAIRGVALNDYSDSNESPVAVYVDDVYLGTLAGHQGQLFDLERVEVLRGPQGTLFGRNATGGLVHFISKKPTDAFDANLSIDTGNYGRRIVEGAVGGGIVSRVRGRIAFKYNDDDGWQVNQTLNTRQAKTDVWAVRGILDIDLADHLTLELNSHFSHENNISPGYGVRGTLNPSNPFNPDGSLNRCSDAAILASQCVTALGFRDPNPDPTRIYSDVLHPRLDIETKGVIGTLKYDLGAVELTSITSYEQADKYYQEDADGSAERLFQVNYNIDAHQLTQELRAGGHYGRGHWVAGLFYYNDTRDHGLIQAPLLIPEFGTLGDQNEYSQRTKSWAAYGQADYQLLDPLTLTLGTRYSSDKKDLTITDDFAAPSFINHEHADTSKVTWKGALDWRFLPDWHTYASVATGFKSPAFNVSLVLDGGAAPVGSETITTYEIGLKGTAWNDTVRFAVSTFYSDYRDLQAVVIPANQAGAPVSEFVNVPAARIYGAEFEASARPLQGLKTSLGLSLLHTQLQAPGIFIGETPIDGHRLGESPQAVLNGIVSYERALGATGL